METQIAARHTGILQPDIILFEWLSPFHTPTVKKLCITLTGYFFWIENAIVTSNCEWWAEAGLARLT